MNSSDNYVFTPQHRSFCARAAQIVTIFLLVVCACVPFYTFADSDNKDQGSGPSGIDIIKSDERYTLFAKQKKLADVLLELANIAEFKFRTFEKPGGEQTDWNYQSMSLDQLLKNLLAGCSTVMLHEEGRDKTDSRNNFALKELWLVSSNSNAAIPGPTSNQFEVWLEHEDMLPDIKQEMTPEQRDAIAHIDNLEGLKSDDVIESLRQTLVGDKDPAVRKRAVAALGDIGGTGVLDALESGMGDRSGTVRIELAKSFATVRHQRSMLALGQLLIGDPDSRVRKAAVASLHQQNSPAARIFVEAALTDRNDEVKKVATEKLRAWRYAL